MESAPSLLLERGGRLNVVFVYRLTTSSCCIACDYIQQSTCVGLDRGMTTHVVSPATWERLVMPSKKQMASKMLLFPLPFSPVMALKSGSNPSISVRCAYDLKPSRTTFFMYISCCCAVSIVNGALRLEFRGLFRACAVNSSIRCCYAGPFSPIFWLP